LFERIIGALGSKELLAMEGILGCDNNGFIHVDSLGSSLGLVK
jgi:hypothetical protein